MSRLWGWRLALPPALVLLLVGGVLPWVSSAYVVSLAILFFLSLTLAQSWNLISGYTGYVSFGHVVFFGVGAYTGALLATRWEWPWLPALLMSGAAAALLALGVGAICLRLRGAYFAIAMLGLNEAVQILASTWESLTGGGLGLTLPPLLEREPIYYHMGDWRWEARPWRTWSPPPASACNCWRSGRTKWEPRQWVSRRPGGRSKRSSCRPSPREWPEAFMPGT